jgi:single-stranded DNA-binding protein
MQQIVIRGNLVKDAELVQIGERQQVKFTVACNKGKGEKKVTTYYDVLSYATYIQPYLLKGKDVVVVGELNVKKDESNGKTYVHLNVYADDVELCGGRGDSAPQATVEPKVQYQAPQPTTNLSSEGELPF